MTGQVDAVHIAPESGADMEHRNAVEAVAGQGLRGDRYFAGTGTYSDSAREVTRDVSLIEREALAALERDYDVSLRAAEHRRNLTTTDIGLNRLVGKRFRVGEVTCEGVELCEPCSYLESLTGRDGVFEGLVHRGGLRASIVSGGTIEVGAPVEVVGDAEDAARSRLRDA
jgi:hypothetical protein